MPLDDGRGAGGLEAHHVGQGAGAFQPVVFDKAFPVGGNVAGVAHRNEEVVRGVAEHVGDFKGGGFLAFNAVGVDGVDQGNGMIPGELTNQAQGSVEIAVHHDNPGAVSHSLGEFAQRHLPLGNQDKGPQVQIRAVGGGRGAGVAGGGAHDTHRALFHGLGDGDNHAPVFEGPGGVAALQLEVELLAAQFLAQAVGLDQGRVPLAQGKHGCIPGERQELSIFFQYADTHVLASNLSSLSTNEHE